MRRGQTAFGLFLAAATLVLVVSACAGREPAGRLVVHVHPVDASPRGFQIDISRGEDIVLHRPLAPLEVKLRPGRYVISVIWMFRGDPHGPPTHRCGSRRLAIRPNVRVDVLVAVKRLDLCPITLGGAG